jgi:hypothetical protein
MPVEGRPPAYNSPLPSNFMAYTLAVPSWEAYATSIIKIYDSEIGYVAHNQWHQLGADLSPILFKAVFPDPTKTLNDLEELVKDGEMKKLVVGLLGLGLFFGFVVWLWQGTKLSRRLPTRSLLSTRFQSVGARVTW